MSRESVMTPVIGTTPIFSPSERSPSLPKKEEKKIAKKKKRNKATHKPIKPFKIGCFFVVMSYPTLRFNIIRSMIDCIILLMEALPRSNFQEQGLRLAVLL